MPGIMYPFSFKWESISPVITWILGNFFVKSSMPSGAEIKFMKTMFSSFTPCFSSTSTAHVTVPPVANIGSSSSTERCAISAGNLAYKN